MCHTARHAMGGAGGNAPLDGYSGERMLCTGTIGVCRRPLAGSEKP